MVTNRRLPQLSYCLGVVLWFGVRPPIARAQDPAEVFPERTLLFFSYSGTDATSRGARGTAMGKLCAEPQVKRFTTEVTDVIDAVIRDNLPGKMVKLYSQVKPILDTIVSRPVGIGLIDLSSGEGKLSVQAAIVCHAGSNSRTLAADLNALLTEGMGIELQEATIAGVAVQSLKLPLIGELCIGVSGDWIIIAAGPSSVETVAKFTRGSKKGSLARSEAITVARKKIGGKSDRRIFCALANLERIAGKARTFQNMLGPAAEGFSTAMGMIAKEGGAKSICFEMYYHANGCLMGTYLARGSDAAEKSEPAAPISDDDLARIPGSASWAAAVNLNLAAGYRDLLDVLKRFGEGFHQGVAEAIKTAEEELGFSIESDLLVNMKDTIIFYDTPDNGGLWFGGTILLAEVAQPDKIQECLEKSAQFLVKKAGDKHVKLASSDYRNHKINYLSFAGLPIPVTPSWTTHGSWLIVGFYPQTVTIALDRLTTSDARINSLLTNQQFAEGRVVVGKLGSSVSFVDTKSAATSTYAFLMPLFHMGASMLRGEGVEMDASIFPPLEALTQHLFADIRTTRSDAQGELSLSYGPLPISAEPLAVTGVVPVTMAVSILLPSLSRARELSKRTVCASNMRGIGQAMYIHAQDDETFGPDFETHIKENNSTPKQFICPSTDCKTGDLQCSYEYIAGQSPDSDPANVLMYEKRDNHREGGNVLFVDLHVDFVKPYDEVERLVEETKVRLREAQVDQASEDDSQDNDDQEGKDE